MKEMSKRTFRKRGLAFIMALLMIVSIFPSAGVTVSAQTDKHQGFVTVTVTDADGAAINGATVTYTIKEKENGTNNFQTINQSGETDSYGTIEVLESSKYYDDLTITASVSKEGYATDTTTINEADITSDTQDFSVKLTAESKPESLPDIDGVSIEVLNADYNGEPQNLVSVSAATEDVTIEYSRDGNTWVATCPSETNAGEYPVYVKITKDGYSTYLSGEQTAKINKPSFKDSVKFGETDAKDQGASRRHYIYLEETATGNITKKVEISNLKLDTIAPYNVNIDFPDVEEKDSVKYYGDYITVTFTAYDVTSGVDHFDWKYTRENGASNSNLKSDNGKVSAQVDKDDPNKYSATLTLPRNKAEQLRGNLQVTAIDKAGNNSVSYTDDGVFVIDTIAPTQKVEYKLKNNEGKNQIVGEKHYFSNDVEFTFKIVEANFYSEDVTITVSKNNCSAEKQSVTWTDTENSDEHQATLTLSDDAEYTVSMTYEDRSGKEMTAYTSETIVVDKTIPKIEFGFKVNEYGVVETRYTLKSVFNGLKAYVMNKPIDTHTEKGIRTLLNQNFKTDFKMFIKSTFSVTAWKDTFKYNVTDGGRISFTEWKNSFSLTAMKDTIKYNMKYSSLKGMFSDGVAWENRKDFIKTTANGFKSIIGVSQKIESIVVGEYSISEDINGKLEEKKTGFSDLTTIKGKIEKLVTKTQGTYKNTYIYKSANSTN